MNVRSHMYKCYFSKKISANQVCANFTISLYIICVLYLGKLYRTNNYDNAIVIRKKTAPCNPTQNNSCASMSHHLVDLIYETVYIFCAANTVYKMYAVLLHVVLLKKI